MNESNYRVHLLYWAIIFVILAVFLVLCVPARINEEAFSNFSFASVLVSIVLAVISIVLSISVGQSTSHYNLEIKDIEKEIQNKIKRFDDLDDSIRTSVESVVKKEVEDVKKKQSEMNKIFESFIKSTNTKGIGANRQSGTLDLSSVSHLCVASLYLACLCSRTQKPLPLSHLAQSSMIIVGFLNALSTVEPDSLKMIVRNKDIFISTFSSNKWGEEIDLKAAVDSIEISGIRDVVMDASKYILEG